MNVLRLKCVIEGESVRMEVRGKRIVGKMGKKMYSNSFSKIVKKADVAHNRFSYFDPGKFVHENVAKSGKPIVAIVGRPNVGKSSMFNRIIRKSKALITDIPGTTRDRAYAIHEWNEWEFILVDTGGMLGDTHEWSSSIHDQATEAIEEADVIVFLCSATDGLHPDEIKIAKLLRKQKKPIILGVNKVDNKQREQELDKFYQLGLGKPIPLSAIHGVNEIDFLDTLTATFENSGFGHTQEENEHDIRIAIVGAPNVGKSSLLNKICGHPRAIVSDVSGTTTDPVDERVMWNYNGEEVPVLLVDTAGIKKKKYQNSDIEKISTMWALKVVERSHITFLVLDSDSGVQSSDTRLSEFINNNFGSSIVIVNKWDTWKEKTEHSKREYQKATLEHLPRIDYSPVLFTSAATGMNVNVLMDMAVKIYRERKQKIQVRKLKETIDRATLLRKPPKSGNRQLKIKFASQADMSAPTIVIFVNHPDLMSPQYEKYISNMIREDFPFPGSPIRIIIKQNIGTPKKIIPKSSERLTKKN